jgi:hypothetical protein
MMTALLTRAGILPALLVVLAGMLVLHTEPDRKAGRRTLGFLLIAGALLAAVAAVAPLLAGLLDNPSPYVVALRRQLTPALIGVLALLLLRCEWPARLGRAAQVVALVLGLVLYLVLTWMSRYAVACSIVADALLLAALWTLVDRFDAAGIALGLVALAFLAFYGAITSTVSASPPPGWLRLPLGIGFLVLPKLAVASAAMPVASATLVVGSAGLLARSQGDGRPRAALGYWRPIAWRLGLALCLVGALAYTILWASIWDQTSDGLGGLFFSEWAGTIAVAAGTVMGLTLTRWRRLAGLAFAVLVPLLMYGAFEYGWGVSYHGLTEARAARIQRAVERYHDRKGRYPGELRELVPRDLLWVPGPVIVQGYGWCYRGAGDGYRLGAYYRETWGLPFSLRVYASAGSAPEFEGSCERELAALKAQRDPPSMVGRSAAPTEEPLPTSVVPIPRTPVQPLLTAGSVALGTWSADGRYLFLGSLDTSADAPSMTLSFVDAGSGGLCHAGRVAPAFGLRDRHAWLPDGRLLFLSPEGEIDLLTPCEAGAERLGDRYPVTFERLVAHDEQSGRVLLAGGESFWILDGQSLEARPIPEVRPNPYPLHWDDAAWSPGGERLAISRLNGRDRKAGSTLYLVAGDTGEVVERLPLEYATDQHAPGVEWLTADELLLQSEGILAIVDTRSEPPRIVDVLQDILDLDVAYPYELSALAWIVHPTSGYHLAVWVNHPRNQNLYLYDSETGRVDVLRPEVHTVLFFPDGTWEGMFKWEDRPTYRDEYELVWVGTDRDAQRLLVEGHTPRDYPHLFPHYLPHLSQMAFASSQGVSLVSIPDGTLLRFWELVDAGGSAYLYPAPDGRALVAVAGERALYWIPLPD